MAALGGPQRVHPGGAAYVEDVSRVRFAKFLHALELKPALAGQNGQPRCLHELAFANDELHLGRETNR